MAKFYRAYIDDLFPADDGEVPSNVVAPLATAYLGQNPLSETYTTPGTAKRTLEALRTMSYDKNPLAILRAHQLYAAWLAFYRGHIQQAQNTALELFEQISKSEVEASTRAALESPHASQDGESVLAQKLGASYLICNLARYGMPRHRTEAAVAFIKGLAQSELHISQAAVINLAMHEMSLGVMSDVPGWIRTGDLGVARVGNSLLFSEDGVRPENLYAAVTAAAQYANYRGDHLRSLNVIDLAQRAFCVGGYLIGDVYFSLYRALNYEALGFSDDTDACLWHALRLVQPDGLWQIVSQFVPSFGERLINMAQGLDKRGAIRCKELSEGLIDRIQASHAAEKELRGHQKLTNQELAVMRLLAQGKKGTEVAKQLCVEPVTVKFHKKNAVRKLGIRATASIMQIQEALERYEISAAWLS